MKEPARDFRITAGAVQRAGGHPLCTWPWPWPAACWGWMLWPSRTCTVGQMSVSTSDMGEKKGSRMLRSWPWAYPWGRVLDPGKPTPAQGSAACSKVELLPLLLCSLSCTSVSSCSFPFFSGLQSGGSILLTAKYLGPAMKLKKDRLTGEKKGHLRDNLLPSLESHVCKWQFTEHQLCILMGGNPFQPKNNSKMAELFSACEEELKPRQKEVKESEDDDGPVFVGDGSHSKSAISNIWNTVNCSLYLRGIKKWSIQLRYYCCIQAYRSSLHEPSIKSGGRLPS